MDNKMTKLMKKLAFIFVCSSLLCVLCACDTVDFDGISEQLADVSDMLSEYTGEMPDLAAMDETAEPEEAAAYAAEEEDMPAVDLINHVFLDKQAGADCIVSNEDYFNRLNQNDIDFRLQKKNGTIDELKDFYAAQTCDFTDDEKAFIDASLERIAYIIAEKGYYIPLPDEITFVKTTMDEECGALAYTHESAIYLGSDYLAHIMAGNSDEDVYGPIDFVLSHEIFHIITRSDKQFKRDMYGVFGATVLDEAIELPENIASTVMANPDVDVWDSFIPLSINGHRKYCVIIPHYYREFYREGQDIFNSCEVKLLLLNSDGSLYDVADSGDFWDVVGTNSQYVLALEEVVADNFAIALTIDDTDMLPDPEIPAAIQDILIAKAEEMLVAEVEADGTDIEAEPEEDALSEDEEPGFSFYLNQINDSINEVQGTLDDFYGLVNDTAQDIKIPDTIVVPDNVTVPDITIPEIPDNIKDGSLINDTINNTILQNDDVNNAINNVNESVGHLNGVLNDFNDAINRFNDMISSPNGISFELDLGGLLDLSGLGDFGDINDLLSIDINL